MGNGMDEDVLHSISPAPFKMGANLRRNISEIVIPSADDIPTRRKFIHRTRNLKASAELIADL